MDDIFTPGTLPIPPSRPGELAWEVAMLFPPQGHWTEAAYLALDTNHRVELVDGCIEVHPMPTVLHQLIVAFIYKLLDAHVAGVGGGTVLFAPLPVRLGIRRYRAPDLVYLRSERLRPGQLFPDGADLAMEVVSAGPANRKRDLEAKPAEYAAAGITEYWIIDPEQGTITVLTLDGSPYREHGVSRAVEIATSLLLPGFALVVQDVFNAGEATH